MGKSRRVWKVLDLGIAGIENALDQEDYGCVACHAEVMEWTHPKRHRSAKVV